MRGDPKVEIEVPSGQGTAVVPLPTWTDSTSIATWLTAIVGAVNGVLVLTHTGYELPTLVEALVAPISFIISGVVVSLNIVRHTNATVAAIGR